MATLLCKEIGIPKVVAKAKNKLQGTILKKVGADTVVYPEIEMGSRVAKSLLATEFTDWIELSNDYSMVEIAVPKPWINHSMAELGVRTKYGVTDVGENKPQELARKYDIIGDKVKWHLIGSLQTNKVKYIIDKFGILK